MRQLPLTGRPVYDIVQKPENNIKTCLIPVPLRKILNATYSSGQADIPRNSNSGSTVHEYFHAAQDMNEKNNDMFSLTMTDGIFSDLLSEASAVAYQLAVDQEARNKGIPLYTRENDSITTADEPQVIQVFTHAYRTALEKSATPANDAAIEKALESGGRAVVRYLMSGKDLFWLNSYAKQAIENANNNADHYQESRATPRYPEKRRTVFLSQGRVSDRINFIPEEMIGSNVNLVIARTLENFGIQVEISAKNTPPAPRRQSTLVIPARKA